MAEKGIRYQVIWIPAKQAGLPDHFIVHTPLTGWHIGILMSNVCSHHLKWSSLYLGITFNVPCLIVFLAELSYKFNVTLYALCFHSRART